MITKFANVYAGHVDLGDMGQGATPANERRYGNEQGLIGGGAATMAEKSIHSYHEAAERAGLDWKLGEGLSLGIFYHLAESRERAVREIAGPPEELVAYLRSLEEKYPGLEYRVQG